MFLLLAGYLECYARNLKESKSRDRKILLKAHIQTWARYSDYPSYKRNMIVSLNNVKAWAVQCMRFQTLPAAWRRRRPCWTSWRRGGACGPRGAPGAAAANAAVPAPRPGSVSCCWPRPPPTAQAWTSKSGSATGMLAVKVRVPTNTNSSCPGGCS